MSLSHVEVAIDWAAAEGWNPGLHDAQCFFAIDPRGFYMAMLDERMIASGAVPIYDAEFAFIGLYIVAPEFRGQGYGLALTKFMLAYAGNRNVGLDVMAERYARLGFRTAHRSVRLAFTPNGTKHGGDRSADGCAVRRACRVRSEVFLRAPGQFSESLDRAASGSCLGFRRCGSPERLWRLTEMP
jgi:GNAT superfamily N-acetyltransferase